jgi:hypothetical protein
MTPSTTKTPTTGIDMRTLPSLSPDSEGIVDLDPYAHKWLSGSTAKWINRDLELRLAQVTKGSLPTRLYNPNARIDFTHEHQQRERLLNVVAALSSFNNLTGSQLAYWTGDARWKTAHPSDMRTLFSGGIIDVEDVGMRRSGAESLTLYRLAADADNVWKGVAAGLSFAEHISVDAGQNVPLVNRRRFDRHDSLNAELARRVSAYVPGIGAVFGERLSTHELLMARAHHNLKLGPTAAADSTWIRGDGLAFGIELQASESPGLDRKLESACRLLQANDSLTFVYLTVPQTANRTRSSISSAVRSAILAAVKRHPQVASRIVTADWLDWIPSPGFVSRDMLDLVVQHVNPWTSQWSSVSLLDQIAVPLPRWLAEQPGRAVAPLVNAAVLRQTPVPQRTALRERFGSQLPELWRLPAFAARLDRFFDRNNGNRGTTGPTTVPDRLRA